MADNWTFRTAMFGGFNKQDVCAYIENRQNEYNAALAEADQKLKEQQAESGQLRAQLDESLSEISKNKEQAAKIVQLAQEQTEQITLLQASISELKQQVDSAEKAAAAAEAESAALRTRLDNAITERDGLSARVTELNERLTNFEQLKLHVADIELAAYARAKDIENSAAVKAEMLKNKMSQLFNDASGKVTAVKSDLNRAVFDVASKLDIVRQQLVDIVPGFNDVCREFDQLKQESEELCSLDIPQSPAADENAALFSGDSFEFAFNGEQDADD